MANRQKREHGQHAISDDEHVKDSNELLALIRRQMVERRSGPDEKRPKKLEIPEPE